MQKLALCGCVEKSRLGVSIDSALAEPGKKLWGRPEFEDSPDRERVMVAGGLIVQHHIIGTRNTHEVVAARRPEEQEKIVC